MKKRVSFIICMIISISIFVSACGTFPSAKREFPDPEVTIEKLLTALSEGDMKTASEISGEDVPYDLSSYDEQTQDFILYYFDQMTIVVNGDPKYKGDTAELSVTFTVPDIKASLDAAIDIENNDFIVLMVKDLLLATINGEDTTAMEDEMLVDFFEEIKAKMADPVNQVSTESSMTMVLNDNEDGWIIDSVSDDFFDPASVDMDSADVSSAVSTAVTDAIPAALDLLLAEGSIDQATYDAIYSSL